MDFLKHIKEFKPTSWSIDNKTSVYIFTILITLTGLSIFISIPKEQYPDIVIPTIFVSTIYPEGANPEDIEKLITKPIENQLKSINGIKRVTSRSVPNLSLVTVEFNTDVETAEAKQKVSDAVDKAKNDLPTDLDQDPQVQEVDISEQPIMQVNIVGDLPFTQLNKYAEDLEDKIEGLKEITRVDVIGAPKREVQVNIDLYKMQMSGFSFSDIENAIAGQNVNISAGELRINELRRTLRVIGEFKNMSDIENIMVRSFRGNTAFLRDIATVTDGFEEKQDFARLDGKAVITLSVIKRAGQNLIEASEKIVTITDEYQRTKLPPGAGITITGDTADQTKVQLNDLINTVILGFLFVFFILLFFMGLESAFFVALAVPLSTMLAFLFMPSLGFTLNIMVLFSLLLALGIIVDDAIVVIENTHRIFHQNPTIDIKTAAKAAAGEVFAPVLAGTLTTIAPFFPLLFWPGIAGKFMKFLPMTLIITLFASLFVAFIMNPVFAVDTMKREDGNQEIEIAENAAAYGHFRRYRPDFLSGGQSADGELSHRFNLVGSFIYFHHPAHCRRIPGNGMAIFNPRLPEGAEFPDQSAGHALCGYFQYSSVAVCVHRPFCCFQSQSGVFPGRATQFCLCLLQIAGWNRCQCNRLVDQIDRKEGVRSHWTRQPERQIGDHQRRHWRRRPDGSRPRCDAAQEQGSRGFRSV